MNTSSDIQFLAYEERNTFFRHLPKDKSPTMARRHDLAKARRLRRIASLAQRDASGLAKGKGEAYWIGLASSYELQAA